MKRVEDGFWVGFGGTADPAGSIEGVLTDDFEPTPGASDAFAAFSGF